MSNKEAGWINLPREGDYEVQKNIFSESYRHRQHKPDQLFHDWFDGKPPYRYLKEAE